MRGGVGKDDGRDAIPPEDLESSQPDSSGPQRRSVIPPSQEVYTFPSGRAARPVEEYLVPEEKPEDSTSESSSEGDEGIPESGRGPRPEGAGSGDEDDGSDGFFGLPRWVPWIVVGVIVAILGTMALVGGIGGEPSPSASVSPTVSPTPEVSSFFDDGIAEDEYPESVDWRGEGYPEALEMADWVWDRVGPQWAIVLMADHGTLETPELAIPVVYLVSPEGVYFELSELPTRVAEGTTLVSWHEEERTARIVWEHGTRGGLLHLETGEVEDTSFSLTAGRTKVIQFLAGSAAGKEIWTAWGVEGLEVRHFAWTPEAGWERILYGQDDVYIEWYTDPTRPDGGAIALQVYSEGDSGFASSRSLPPGHPNLVVYWLDSGESRQIQPTMPYAEPDCWFTGWRDLVSVGYMCWDDNAGVESAYRVLVDGSGVVEEGWATIPWFEDVAGQETVRNPNGTVDLVVDPVFQVVESVRVLQDDGFTTVVDKDTHFGGSGKSLALFDEISPGVFRLVTYDGIVIGIDVATATIGPTVVATTDSGAPLLGRSYVFYEEATPPGTGLTWGD